MFKNPRGLCLIMNIYQIDGMPPRRWSDRDTESLKQLFEQLLFNVKIYTDSTHDLSCKVNFFFIISISIQLERWSDFYLFLTTLLCTILEFQKDNHRFFKATWTRRCSVLCYLFDVSWRRGLSNHERRRQNSTRWCFLLVQ